MTVRIGKYESSGSHLAVILLAAAWLAYAALMAPAGLFTDDEIIYVAMIDRFATAGSFIIENGYDLIPAESLRLVTMQVGPHGLVPQYPAGFAILAAPFYLAGGLQGIIFLNALASVLTLWLTYLIARELFQDKGLAINAALIFGLATFAVDYAFAIWPHAMANLMVAAAVYAGVLSLRRDAGAWRPAAMAGLLLGIGATIRVDVLIAAPVLLVWLFVNTRRPGRILGAFIAALSCGLLIAAWLNYLKFGMFNPVTYGIGMAQGGGLSLGMYSRYVPYAILGGLAVLGLRSQRVQQLVSGKSGLVALAGVILLLSGLPFTREMIIQTGNGFYSLIIDLRHMAAIDTHPRIQNIGGNFYVYYGTLKKSLLESLPYLGLALFALVPMFRSRRRAAYALCLLLPLVWFMPFVVKEWVGGRANNLRYLSPVLPYLAILAALGWRRISTSDEGRAVNTWLSLAIAALVCAALLFAWSQRHAQLGFSEAFFVTGGVQWFALMFLVSILAWAWFPALRAKLQVPLKILAQTAFVLAFVAAYAFDVVETWETRAAVENHVSSLQYLESNAHVFATGQFALYFLLTEPKATLAFYEPDDIQSDLKFIDAALEQGRPVYVMTLELARILRKALLDNGYNAGPQAMKIQRSVSPVDGQHYGLYQVYR